MKQDTSNLNSLINIMNISGNKILSDTIKSEHNQEHTPYTSFTQTTHTHKCTLGQLIRTLRFAEHDKGWPLTLTSP